MLDYSTVAWADAVEETSTTTGTGTFSLAGATTNHLTFVAGVGSSKTVVYFARLGSAYERGYGVVTSGSPDTLTRVGVLQSSNGNALVSFGAGTKTIAIDANADLLQKIISGKFVSYPYAPPPSADANNDEFDGAGPAWTVATALTSPNVHDINGNSNSLLLAHVVNGTGDVLALTRTLSGTWTGDISLTARFMMGKFGNYVNVQAGFLDATLNAGLVVVVDGSSGTVYLFSTSAFATGGTHSTLQTWSSAFPTGSNAPSLHGYIHFQRVSGTWSIWWSSDGIGWNQLGTDSTALTVVGSGVLLAGFGVGGKYTLGMDFIRYNWLFLP